MTSIRQDAWNQDEDRLLAETVLSFIKDGGTQLAAFEEVGRKLSRTTAACGFRWNSLVRKQYKAMIDEAKSLRREKIKKNRSERGIKKEKTETYDGVRKEGELSMQEVINFLMSYDDKNSVPQEIEMKVEALKKDLTHANEEKVMLARDFDRLKREYETLRAEYETIISFMTRAKKYAVKQQ